VRTARLTSLEGIHGQDTREHALVVTIQNTTDASKQGNAEHLPVFHQRHRAGRAHHALPPLERGIVDGSADIAGRNHDDSVLETCCRAAKESRNLSK
jgi:hypothetical protein